MQFQEEISFPDGIHTFLTEKFPLYDEVGEIYAVAGISSDITKQKKVKTREKKGNERGRERNIKSEKCKIKAERPFSHSMYPFEDYP